MAKLGLDLLEKHIPNNSIIGKLREYYNFPQDRAQERDVLKDIINSLVNDSNSLQAGGDQHNIQKSTKEIKLPSKVSEMRKIWEQNIVSKYTDGPRISETKSICAKPMGGLEKPTVFGTSQQRW